MRILLVEDDDRIARPLAEDLSHQNHIVDLAHDGLEGWQYAQAIDYELILLDLMLPKLDGITLCKQLRMSGSQALILMLTARDTTSDKVIGLDAGADDYLVKPFELEELAARIRALSRRTPELKPLILTHDGLQLDPSSHKVAYAGKELSLTPKEYMLLECFLRNPTQILTRAFLLERLWDLDQTAGEETIKTHLTNLRRKLKSAGATENVIETVYGVGYRLQAEC
ncbi:MAG: response regulator transcription factor [Leptolyngbya sp. BL-A-14]